MDKVAKDYRFFRDFFYPGEELKQDKKFHPIIDQDLLQKKCPQCGSNNPQKHRDSYTCFRCGKVFLINSIQG